MGFDITGVPLANDSNIPPLPTALASRTDTGALRGMDVASIPDSLSF